jgi:hypothetical protein
MNRFLAAELAAVPIALLGVVYLLVAGRQFVRRMQAAGVDLAPLSDDQVYYLFLATFALAPFFFAVAAAVVYGWAGSAGLFLGVTVGLALLLSVVALATRTPLAGWKIAANFVVALGFGLLLPLLAA